MSVGVVSFAAPVHDGAAVIAQDDASNVMITYGIKDEPAIVTVDIQTNSPIGWLSIDQTWLTNVTGDVNKKVDVDVTILVKACAFYYTLGAESVNAVAFNF